MATRIVYHICRLLGPAHTEDVRRPIGLKDKFGQEIFEGDIVEYYDALWVVRKEGPEYWIANPENDDIPVASDQEILESSQVLGSIYEDPLAG